MRLPVPVPDAPDPLAQLDPQTRERFEQAGEKKWRAEYARLNARIYELTQQKDSAYSERDMCVAFVASAARAMGCRVGLGQHDPCDTKWEADWRTIVFIDLPTGQVSWHIHDSEREWFKALPGYDGMWDGHDTAEKYRRLLASCRPFEPGEVLHARKLNGSDG